MADDYSLLTTGERIEQFVYDHSPKAVQNWLERRDLNRQAEEQYALYEKREAAGYYDETKTGSQRRAISSAIQSDSFAQNGPERNLWDTLKDFAFRHAPEKVQGWLDENAPVHKIDYKSRDLTKESLRAYENDMKNGADVVDAWENHQRRLGITPDSEVQSNNDIDAAFDLSDKFRDALDGELDIIVKLGPEVMKNQIAVDMLGGEKLVADTVKSAEKIIEIFGAETNSLDYADGYDEYVAETRREEKAAKQSWQTDLGEGYMADAANRQEVDNDLTQIPFIADGDYGRQQTLNLLRTAHNTMQMSELAPNDPELHKVARIVEQAVSQDENAMEALGWTAMAVVDDRIVVDFDGSSDKPVYITSEDIANVLQMDDAAADLVNPGLAAEEHDHDGDYDDYDDGPRNSKSVETFGLNENGHLHRDPREGPAQITTQREDWGDGFGRTTTTELYAVNGELIARSEAVSSRHEEGYSYKESWHDPEGNLHSFNGNPAEIIEDNHDIPSETYLDESKRSFYNHGEFVDSIDTTYEDIVSSKPLSVQQAAGWSVDGLEDANLEPRQIEKYAGRFDEPRTIETVEVQQNTSQKQIDDMTEEEFIDWADENLGPLSAIAEPGTREDRFGEITRKYSHAIGSDQTETAQPTLKPMDIESYKQEQAFYGKHQQADLDVAWNAQTGTFQSESHQAERSNGKIDAQEQQTFSFAHENANHSADMER